MEHQRSVNEFRSCIMHNPRAMEHSWSTINQLAASIGNTASDHITSTSYNWVPTEGEQLLWRFSMPHSNELHCGVPKVSFTRSVYSICPSIQLYKYACNVSQIWYYCLDLKSPYLRTRILLCYNETFSSLLSRISQHSNPYRHVGFKIFKYLIAKGYDLFQKWTWLDSWFEWPYFTNPLRCLVGCNECRLDTFQCLEWFLTCVSMEIVFALRNRGDLKPWNHLYRWRSSSLPCIRTWDKLNGETPAGKSSHGKVQWANRVECHWID